MIKLSSWQKFKVRSLDEAELRRASGELAVLARGFQPNVIIGIKSGGYQVAKRMAENLPEAVLLAITCRRPSTQKKNRYPVFKYLLSRLPHLITDRLRIVEHIITTRLYTPKLNSLIPDAGELAVIEQALHEFGSDARILIVDDAVDSGATMACVHKTIKAIANPAAAIKIAAITITTASPFIEPDFSLYRYVLCRFLWSLDFKN